MTLLKVLFILICVVFLDAISWCLKFVAPVLSIRLDRYVYSIVEGEYLNRLLNELDEL